MFFHHYLRLCVIINVRANINSLKRLHLTCLSVPERSSVFKLGLWERVLLKQQGDQYRSVLETVRDASPHHCVLLRFQHSALR